MKIEVGKRYLVKDIYNKINGRESTNKLDEVFINEISPNGKYARANQWFLIEDLNIIDVLADNDNRK